MSRFLGGLPRFPWSISESWINRSFQKTTTNAPNTENRSVGHHNRSPILPLPSDFSQQDWRPTNCDGLGKYRTPHSIRSLARFPGAKGLFFRPKIRLTDFRVLTDFTIGHVRGVIQKGDVIEGTIVNYGESADEVTVSIVIEGLVPRAEPLSWPRLQNPFDSSGWYPTVLSKLGNGRREDFRFATKNPQTNSWTLDLNPIKSPNVERNLKPDTTYEGRLFIHEGSGGHETWEFSLRIDAEGKASFTNLKKIRWG